MRYKNFILEFELKKQAWTIENIRLFYVHKHLELGVLNFRDLPKVHIHICLRLSSCRI